VPVVVGAPALGRYCAFGNLFARLGAEGEVFRIDRHPSMSRHPVTPMDEADLRVHLGKQTSRRIGLLDFRQLDRFDADDVFDAACRAAPVLLIDLLSDAQHAAVGRLLNRAADRRAPLFVVGSSGVESALTAHWCRTPSSFPPPRSNGPVLVACGSRSPVTAEQMRHAIASGFEDVPFDREQAVRGAADLLARGRSVILHTRDATASQDLGRRLGAVVRAVVDGSGVRRLIVAGGDTSGAVAQALGIESLEMIAPLTRGAPLCRATARPGGSTDGLEVVFKGGQIGPADFFAVVRG
jgi:uncharacterized protein YgbK (DUF1537 family)